MIMGLLILPSSHRGLADETQSQRIRKVKQGNAEWPRNR